MLLGMLLLVFLGCQNTPDADKVWRLGWRLNMDVFDEDYTSASGRFDSLLTLSQAPELAFLINGLRAKVQIGQIEEAQAILQEMPEDLQQQACPNLDTAIFSLCQGLPVEPVTHPNIQLDIIRMFVADQAIRGHVPTRLIESFGLDSTAIPDPGQSGVQVDANNRKRLKEIIEAHGFPTLQMVGREAMDGVFFIIQHADGDPEWQAAQLPRIEEAVKRGDLDGQRYAYLYDRIQRNSGKPQRYGTQFQKVDPVTGILELAEVEDPDNLDQRRREIGLMPIDTYKDFMLKSLHR